MYDYSTRYPTAPNLLPILGAALVGGSYSLVFPYMEHGNLQDYISKNPNLPLALRLRLALETIAALLYIHSKGFVHGNLKPQNILISPSRSALLADAVGWTPRRRGPEPSEYIAPELLQNRVAPSMKSDCYALGKLLARIATEPGPSAPAASSLASIATALTRSDPAARIDARTALAMGQAAMESLFRSSDFTRAHTRMGDIVQSYARVVHSIRNARKNQDVSKHQISELATMFRNFRAEATPTAQQAQVHDGRLQKLSGLIDEDRGDIVQLRQYVSGQDDKISELSTSNGNLERTVVSLRKVLNEVKLENAKLSKIILGLTDRIEQNEWSDPEPTNPVPSEGGWDGGASFVPSRHEQFRASVSPVRRMSEPAIPKRFSESFNPSPRLNAFDARAAAAPITLQPARTIITACSAQPRRTPASELAPPQMAHPGQIRPPANARPSSHSTERIPSNPPRPSSRAATTNNLPPLPTPFTSVENFEAFAGAGKLPFLAELFSPAAPRRKGKDLLGVRFSAVAETPIPGGDYNGIATCVTGSGVFVWYDFAKKALHLFDLARERHAVVKGIRDYCFVASVGDLVAVGLRKASVLLRATAAKLFEAPVLATFLKGAVPEINGAIAATDLAPWTAKVVYRGPYFYPVELDIRTLQYTIHRDAGQLSCLLSLTGIAVPGVRCVAYRKARDSLSIFAFDDDWRERAISAVQKTAYTFLPSEVAPADLTRGAWVDHSGTLYHDGRAAALTAPFQPRVYHSFVRVFRDAFLVFDEKRRAWLACRVGVP
eukprot:gnl/Chilomastix_cuspidata/2475.p1 GENE.gnl/Chilomastix_cuspidata/2475~~gnl/Chilomastix_cuspidata/2475.p1  ORF type:complete len:865 (+),score=237.40 gnl/Chilomastix_cuspidata/2475:267-2597(+)